MFLDIEILYIWYVIYDIYINQDILYIYIYVQIYWIYLSIYICFLLYIEYLQCGFESGYRPQKVLSRLKWQIEPEEKGHQWQPALMILEQAATEA